nr:uncharacterized protein LOC112026346 [Quercus suber]
MDRIKNESYFLWPNKMGDPLRRNQNLYYTYHRDKGHTTEQCRVLKDHIEQLVKAGYLKEFIVDLRNQEVRQGTRSRGNPLPPLLGVIKVIHATSRGTHVSKRRGVLAVVPTKNFTGEQPSKKKLKFIREPIAFNNDDLEGTVQPRDDALVVTAWINGFIVRASMKDEDKVEMLLFLVQNIDIFAWSLYKVPGIDPEFIVNKLNMDPLYPPKKQKLRKSAKEHLKAVRQEVKRLKEAGAIKDIFFLE